MPDPLDLARCRELASELVADARSGHLGILYSHGEGAIANTATALRAACDEVEKLREAVSAADAVARKKLRKFWKEHDVCLNCGRLKPLKSERPPLMLDYEEVP